MCILRLQISKYSHPQTQSFFKMAQPKVPRLARHSPCCARSVLIRGVSNPKHLCHLVPLRWYSCLVAPVRGRERSAR